MGYGTRLMNSNLSSPSCPTDTTLCKSDDNAPSCCPNEYECQYDGSSYQHFCCTAGKFPALLFSELMLLLYLPNSAQTPSSVLQLAVWFLLLSWSSLGVRVSVMGSAGAQRRSCNLPTFSLLCSQSSSISKSSAFEGKPNVSVKCFFGGRCKKGPFLHCVSNTTFRAHSERPEENKWEGARQLRHFPTTGSLIVMHMIAKIFLVVLED